MGGLLSIWKDLVEAEIYRSKWFIVKVGPLWPVDAVGPIFSFPDCWSKITRTLGTRLPSSWDTKCACVSLSACFCVGSVNVACACVCVARENQPFHHTPALVIPFSGVFQSAVQTSGVTVSTQCRILHVKEYLCNQLNYGLINDRFSSN